MEWGGGGRGGGGWSRVGWGQEGGREEGLSMFNSAASSYINSFEWLRALCSDMSSVP